MWSIIKIGRRGSDWWFVFQLINNNNADNNNNINNDNNLDRPPGRATPLGQKGDSPSCGARHPILRWWELVGLITMSTAVNLGRHHHHHHRRRHHLHHHHHHHHQYEKNSSKSWTPPPDCGSPPFPGAPQEGTEEQFRLENFQKSSKRIASWANIYIFCWVGATSMHQKKWERSLT